ncbi:hypothetical protein [Neisseria sp.]|uniref:hypothetical protein n=1 Tax=Neisseria sp. TaxID=192066 RepID=UPI0026DBECF0|nr:hypothetical protein [Neisseria sp.]MDO4906380.1 hypothetical protein [Neisseria sp.]
MMKLKTLLFPSAAALLLAACIAPHHGGHDRGPEREHNMQDHGHSHGEHGHAH